MLVRGDQLLPSDVSWANWDKLYLDTSLWEAPVRRVLSEVGFRLISIEAGFPGTSAVFRANCALRGGGKEQAPGRPLSCHDSGQQQTVTLIVKFYPPMVRRDFLAEQSVYRALSPDPPFPIPQVVATGVLQDTIEWPYVILEESRGTALRELREALAPADLCDIAAQVGTHLRALHGTDRNRVPELQRDISQWKAWARSRLALPSNYREYSLGRKQCFDGRLSAPAFLQSAGMSVVESLAEDDLSLIHADLTEDHVLLVPKGSSDRPPTPQTGQLDSHGPSRWQVEALFDFGDAEVAPPYYEWIPVWYSLLRQSREAFTALLFNYRNAHNPRARGLPTGRAGHSLRDIMLTFTFIHRFGAQTVKETLERKNVTPEELVSFAELARVLFPTD